MVKVAHTGDGRADGIYTFGTSGSVNYRPPSEMWGDDVGYGWDVYNMTFSPGNLGGDVPSDILARDAKGGDANKDGRTDPFARDAAGVLWQYAGAGNAAAPYKPKATVNGGPENDSRGWNKYSFPY
ncbi:hypothetical protein ACLQ2N_13100 [Streptomyces sp. DT224]|uniref:hypothetical protein n=1 Tax=Streptomyces sp. DT224 TaxID=3393426 RepID=UPI003CEA58CF